MVITLDGFGSCSTSKITGLMIWFYLEQILCDNVFSDIQVSTASFQLDFQRYRHAEGETIRGDNKGPLNTFSCQFIYLSKRQSTFQ